MKKVLPLYGVLLVIMTAGMIAITQRLLALEWHEQIASLRAESERLALWRIESHLLPIVLRESSRDYVYESAFEESDSRLPPEVLLLFRGDANETIVFAEKLASHVGKSENVVSKRGKESLNVLTQDIRDTRFVEALRQPMGEQEAFAMMGNGTQKPSPTDNTRGQSSTALVQQAARSQNEFLSRSRNSVQNSLLMNERSQLAFASSEAPPMMPMRAIWFDDRLYLARLTYEGKSQQAEGCRFDWPYLKAALIQQVIDLLPNADLVPLIPGASGDYHAIANLPLRLIPGEPNLQQLAGSSTLKPTLLVAWGCFLLSAVALGGLMIGTVRLSERRAAFVSAVTHELRTPLTTFRLYSDLLVDRSKLTDEKYARYITTLRNEAERLQHLIENVLSWSRLERSAELELTEAIEWPEFLHRVEVSIRERCQQASMSLLVEMEHMQSLCFHGNRTSVERILFNLVDNSCKYAKSSQDKRIHLEVESDDGFVLIIVRDHGPGIATDVRSRLFLPFAKSASEAATTAPGIGLGLSLSRRLARDMGGDLRLKHSSLEGTAFELRLPKAELLPT